MCLRFWQVLTAGAEGECPGAHGRSVKGSEPVQQLDLYSSEAIRRLRERDFNGSRPAVVGVLEFRWWDWGCAWGGGADIADADLAGDCLGIQSA